MEYIHFLVLIAACQGIPVQKPLPQPELLALTSLHPPSLEVEWAPLKSDEAEPIVGYKVKVWELPPVETFKYVEKDGVQRLVQEISLPKFNEAETPPEEDARTIVVPDPTVAKARIPNIKLNAVYEVRVQAFSKTQDGPLSTHMRVQLLDQQAPQKTHDKDVYKFV